MRTPISKDDLKQVLAGQRKAGSSARHTALVKSCLEYLEAQRIDAAKTPCIKGWLVDTYTRQQRRFEAGKKGWADITGYLPGAFGTLAGKALLVECKTGKGRLEKEQREHRDKAVAAGAVHIVARDSVQNLHDRLEELKKEGRP